MTVDVVVAPASAVLDALDDGVRSDDERARADRIVADGVRRDVVASQLLTRAGVAERARCESAALRFDRTCAHCGDPRHGKPTACGIDVRFSTSRSRGWVAVAVSSGDGDIGIDVEHADREIGSGPARLVCTARERAWLPSTSPDERRHLWVLKEAIGKALGFGLVGIEGVEVAPALHEAARNPGGGVVEHRGSRLRVVVASAGPCVVGVAAIATTRTSETASLGESLLLRFRQLSDWSAP